jgi:hypothetical protein
LDSGDVCRFQARVRHAGQVGWSCVAGQTSGCRFVQYVENLEWAAGLVMVQGEGGQRRRKGLYRWLPAAGILVGVVVGIVFGGPALGAILGVVLGLFAFLGRRLLA